MTLDPTTPRLRERRRRDTVRSAKEANGMPDPVDRIRQTLIERVRQIVDQHHESQADQVYSASGMFS